MTPIWHTEMPQKIADDFKVDLSLGLTETEAQSRLKKYGPNLLTKQKISLVTAEILRAFGARSDTKTIWQLGFFSNIRLFFVVSMSFILQILIHHMPILQEIFGIGAVSWKECVSWVALGMVPLLILECRKLLRKVPDVRF